MSDARIPQAAITGPYGYLIKRMTKKMLGKVPDGVGVMWHNRPVLMHLSALGRKVDTWDQLDPNLKSFAHMAVSAQIGCSFCLDFQYFHAHNKGLDLAKASQVPRWRSSDVFTPLERDAPPATLFSCSGLIVANASAVFVVFFDMAGLLEKRGGWWGPALWCDGPKSSRCANGFDRLTC